MARVETLLAPARELPAANWRMTALLNALVARDGVHPTTLDHVQLLRASRPIPRKPVFHDPRIVIVGQGRKRGYLGDQVYTWDAHNYLVVSVPLPFECETEASPERPMLAVSIGVDLAVLTELLMKMDGSHRPATEAVPEGIYVTELDARLSEATVRLLECLADPVESRILGPQVVREITYRVLCGQQGGALRAAAALHSRFGQINRALQRIHAEYALDLSVEDLAETAGMSTSAFHLNFKAVTTTSPLQYLKSIRLHRARMLMVHEGLRAGVAAGRVGYESSSQFSREFKRLFGVSPIEEIERARQTLGVAASAEA